MSIKISVEILEATYELLRETRPFKRWKLPHADDISFSVIADPENRGEFYVDILGTPWIAASQDCHDTLAELIETVAHEMCHLHEHLQGLRKDVKHGWFFKRCADHVCKVHKFDRKEF